MKLCVLKSILPTEPLFSEDGRFLYYLPIDKYKKEILKGNVSTLDDDDAWLSHGYIQEFNGNYSIIQKDIRSQAEAYISKSGIESYFYARDILKGRFILGEQAISMDAQWVFIYATRVLKERFILGEKVIKDSAYGIHYETTFKIKL